MASGLAAEWRSFRDDSPGTRFINHHQRMRQDGTRLGAIARVIAGVVLISGGIVLLFIPGPGLLLILFGFGLLGGESALVARGLDRIEPAMRRRGRRVKRWWSDRSRIVQASIGVVAFAGVAGAAFTAWRVLT